MFLKLVYNIILSPSEVKELSETYLIEKGAKVCNGLPYTPHNSPRKVKEIAQRALILLAFFNIYMGAPFEAIKRWLEEHQLLPYLSEHEKWLLTFKS